MPAYDPRFKTLIQVFFADFLKLFFSDWVHLFDLDHVEWIKQEIIPNPPSDTRHVLDLVAKLRLKQPLPGFEGNPAEECFAVIHFEIESPDRMTSIDSRMPTYHIHLRNHTGLPVLPIVIFLKVVGDGIGIRAYSEQFHTLETLRFQYLYVALAGLDAVEYLKGDNYLGVALSALMRIPRDQVAWLGAEALRKISEAPINPQQRFLLGECVSAYLPLDAETRNNFDQLLLQEAYTGAKSMNKTYFEQGVSIGLIKAIGRLLRSKFQLAIPDLKERLAPLPDDELENLVNEVQIANSPDDLPSVILNALRKEEPS
jgi:hypothetical protein